MKQDDPQFKLRLPPELKEKLEKAAKASTRTVGAEIVARLQASFGDEQSTDPSLPVKTVVSFRCGTEGKLLNMTLSEEILDTIVRPAIVDLVRTGLEKWMAEQSGDVFEQSARTELQLVVKKRA